MYINREGLFEHFDLGRGRRDPGQNYLGVRRDFTIAPNARALLCGKLIITSTLVV